MLTWRMGCLDRHREHDEKVAEFTSPLVGGLRPYAGSAGCDAFGEGSADEGSLEGRRYRLRPWGESAQCTVVPAGSQAHMMYRRGYQRFM